MTADILSLDQVSDNTVGGKAYGLSRLVAMGLAVPPAFVIRGARSDGYPDDLDHHYHTLACDKVAVRSSAQGEDGAEASFAGQYDVRHARALSDVCRSNGACAYRASGVCLW